MPQQQHSCSTATPRMPQTNHHSNAPPAPFERYQNEGHWEEIYLECKSPANQYLVVMWCSSFSVIPSHACTCMHMHGYCCATQNLQQQCIQHKPVVTAKHAPLSKHKTALEKAAAAAIPPRSTEITPYMQISPAGEVADRGSQGGECGFRGS